MSGNDQDQDQDRPGGSAGPALGSAPAPAGTVARGPGRRAAWLLSAPTLLLLGLGGLGAGAWHSPAAARWVLGHLPGVTATGVQGRFARRCVEFALGHALQSPGDPMLAKIVDRSCRRASICRRSSWSFSRATRF